MHKVVAHRLSCKSFVGVRFLVTDRRLFCFGLGYSAQGLAHRLMARGWRVAGTTRTPEKAEALRKAGIEAYVFDRGRSLEDAATALAGTTELLVSLPPDAASEGGAGDAALDQHRDALINFGGALRWVGYLSTTGVYGDRDGGWVDEDSDLRPSHARSRRRVAAEQGWLSLWREEGQPVHVFRLAGIYGPGRSTLDAVRNGTARRIDAPEQKFSRIHVEDIANALEASIDRPNPGRIYNLCDDEPASPADVTAFACGLLGVEPPPLVPLDMAEMSEMGRSFWQDNKRVSNRRLREELGVDLAYPDYRAGLRGLMQEQA